MFDLNQILSAALNAAVAEAIKPLVERIEKLESTANANNFTVGGLETRVKALENNPAVGVDTTLLDRVVALEEGCVGIDQRLLEQRVALLEQRPVAPAVAGVITPEMIVESMNKAEWLWEKVNAYIETGIEDRIERAIDDHCSTYDHDSYDSVVNEWGSEEVSDFVKEGDLDDKIEEQVNEVLRNASFEIRVL
jgi:hypothetical protein